MTRRRLEMKRIEDKSRRLVTFCKRRKGLMKKCRDLSVLCDLDVAVIVFSNDGKRYEFCTPSSFAEIFRRYQDHIRKAEVSEGVNKAEVYLNCYHMEGHSGNAMPESFSELLQIVKRHIECQAVEELTVAELVKLEKELNYALMDIKSRKTEVLMEPIESLHDKQRMLGEENERLKMEILELENYPPPKTLFLLQ